LGESGRTPFRFRNILLHILGAFTAITDSIATAAPQTFIPVCKGMFFRHIGEHVWIVESAEPFAVNMGFNNSSERLGRNTHNLIDSRYNK